MEKKQQTANVKKPVKKSVKKSNKKKPDVVQPVDTKYPYRTMTIQDIIDFVTKFSNKFPKGLNTPIFSGDFECSYTHLKHELQMLDEKNQEPAIVLAYEMHEGAWEE